MSPEQRRPLTQLLHHPLRGLRHRGTGRERYAAAAGGGAEANGVGVPNLGAEANGVGVPNLGADVAVVDAEHLGDDVHHGRARTADVRVSRR